MKMLQMLRGFLTGTQGQDGTLSILQDLAQCARPTAYTE